MIVMFTCENIQLYINILILRLFCILLVLRTDKIHYEMLRHLSDSACDFLLRLYNKIWLERAFPVQWDRAIILPIVKKDKSPTQAEDYRLIALTSCVCKLLERVVNYRL